MRTILHYLGPSSPWGPEASGVVVGFAVALAVAPTWKLLSVWWRFWNP